MKNAIDFVRFALSHAKRETIPAGAQIPLDIEECGTSPWEYLFGTTGNIVTQDLLNRRFSEYYSKRGWTRERFDRATENWAARRVTVCDCQGLLDVFVGVDVTRITAMPHGVPKKAKFRASADHTFWARLCSFREAAKE